MHRIDTPTAQVDKFGAGKNGFTGGNPQTGELPTALDENFFDSLQEEIAYVIEGAGVTLDKGKNNQLLAALNLLFKQPVNYPGIVGQSRNARMTVATASTVADFYADELIVNTALGGSQFRLKSVNARITLTTVGVGGMATGSAPVTGFLAVYVIYNPTNANVALLGVDATSAIAPEVYSGPNMPSGFTASALVSVWGTDGNRNLIPGYQFQRAIRTNQITLLDSTSTPSTATALNISSAVPRNARNCFIYVRSRASAGTGSIGFALSADANGIGRTAGGIYVGTGQSAVSYDSAAIPIQMITAQTIYYYTSINGPTAYQFTIYCSGYEF